MKRDAFFLIPVLVLMLAGPSCKREVLLFERTDDIYGLASSIKLSGDTTLVLLSDYFPSHTINRVDSAIGHHSLQLKLDKENHLLQILAGPETHPPLSELIVWASGVPYSFFVEKDIRQRVHFVFDPGDKKYSRVSIRGEMNDWHPTRTPLHLIDGVWQTWLNLSPGRYQYLIVANGNDMLDHNNPIIADNNIGGFNSMLEVGAFDPSRVPFLSPSGIGRHEITVDVQNTFEDFFVFWQNHRLPREYISRHGDHLHIRIPGDAYKMQRSYLRLRAYNLHGPSNDLLIALEKGRPLQDPGQFTREDKESTILYFMMVDRFHNGDPRNDKPVEDPEVAPRANYHGGDLAGITEKLRSGYFSMLGVNTIWMSPITQNPETAFVEFPAPNRKYTGYHGYWPITLTTVDHRFGTDDDMHQLVEAAHGQGMRVMLDFVSNHVHKENPLIVNNPHWATQLELPDGGKNIRLWDSHRLTTWFDTFLPSLDFSQPEVIRVMTDSAFFWIDQYQLDGFRHDATKHIPQTFWRELTRKLKEDHMIANNRRLFQIGETFGSRELIGSYIGSGLLDGQFDFNLYFDARSVFALDNESFHKLNYSLHQSFRHYGFHNLMGNITGNHDLPRFISLAGGALRFDERDQEAGWQREVGVGNPDAYDKLTQLTAFIMTIPGVPVIYYGDEIGLPGAGDPDSRRPMIFDGLSEQQEKVRNRAARLAHLRLENLAFVYGDFKTLHVTDTQFAYARRYFDQAGMVLMNKSDKAETLRFKLPRIYASIPFDAVFGTAFEISDGVLSITLPPRGVEVLSTFSTKK